MSIANQSFEERRIFHRFLSRFPARLKDAREDFGETLVLRDASAEGARVFTTEHFFLDDNLTLEVELPDGKAPLVMRGRVVWKHTNNDRHWDVGIQFHKPEFVRLSRLFEITHPETAEV